MKKKDEIKVCLVGSSGGHLTHLYMLKPFWKDKNRFWVTFDKEDARSLLEGEKVYPCYFPTNRSIKALIKNTKIAWDVLHKEKPDLIISCGAAVAVPFFYIGKMMGAKLVYVHPDEIEAITREFAAIGNNLNQIAMFFNSGGIQSRAMLETINHAIACIAGNTEVLLTADNLQQYEEKADEILPGCL